MSRITFLFLALLCVGQLSAQCPSSSRAGIHVVQAGENLFRISQSYGVSIDQLRAWNNMVPGEFLPVCKELNVSSQVPTAYSTTPSAPGVQMYSRGGAVTTTPTSSTAYRKQPGTNHTVQPGETVAGLADLYGYTEKRFREFNALGNEVLTPGSKVLSTDCACGNRASYQANDGLGYTPGATVRGNNYNGSTYTGSTTVTPTTPRTTYTPTTTREDVFGNPFSTEGTTGTTRTGTGSTGTSRTGTTNPPVRRATPTSPSRTTAKAAAAYMRSEELSMIDEINLLRSNPRGYVTYVRDYAARSKSGQTWPVNQATVDELIGELDQLGPLSTLTPMQCVYEAARKHGEDIRQRGRSGHVGSDGSYPWDRVLRECPSLADGNENLVAGPDNVRDAVIMLLIDDGIPNRGHRRTLLNPEWKYSAPYKIGKVGMFPNSWVQKFAR